MIVTKKALARRTFLKGIGATVALPFLDAMAPALSAMPATTASPLRLGFIYIPMGANIGEWTPRSEGKLTQLSPILDVLLPFRDKLTVITNLELAAAVAPTNGNHATSNCTFLSGVRAKMTEGNDYYLGTTIDQIAAQRIGKETPLPSLELGTDLIAQVGNCDNGFACAYQNCLSWSSPTTPLAPEADPRVIFERLFGDGGTPAEQLAELRTNRSILDSVSEDIARLQRQIGQTDRTKVDAYLDSLREVERRIQKAEQQNAKSVDTPLERPVSLPASWEDHVKLMFDLQVLALRTDLTRIITFQLAREASTRTYPQIGVPEAHHPVSHHRNNPVQLAKLAKINAYHVSLIAYFLDKLKSTPDGDGFLLDHSIYMVGSGMGNPDAHTHSNLPAFVAGGGSGKIRGGLHIKYPNSTPMANLHLSLLDRMGIHLESFGDSTGKIGEILQS
jgi:Protein of unknown function (DUF1552)